MRVTLRPLGSALPLGFFAFGVGMAILGAIDIPLLPQSQLHQLAIMLLTFVAPLEILAAVFAFLSRDGMAGTGLGLFAASWTTIGVQDLLGKPGTTSPALGLYLISFSAVVAILGSVARRGQPLLALILLISFVRTALAGVYEITSIKPIFTTAGIIGLLLTLLAFYGALAFLLEDTAHRTVLPLGRRGSSKSAVRGSILDQIEGVEFEAGIRRTL